MKHTNAYLLTRIFLRCRLCSPSLALRRRLRLKTARQGMPPSAGAFDRRTSSIPTRNSKCSGPTCTRPAWLPRAFSRNDCLATARALGLVVPAPLLARADEMPA